jgi:hypothetical protein
MIIASFKEIRGEQKFFWNQMKMNLPQPLGYSKGNSKQEIYSHV